MKIVAFLFLFPSAGKRGRREKVVWLLLSCSPLETHVSALAGGNQGREPGKGEALSPAMPPHTRCVTHREKGGQLPGRERPPQKKNRLKCRDRRNSKNILQSLFCCRLKQAHARYALLKHFIPMPIFFGTEGFAHNCFPPSLPLTVFFSSARLLIMHAFCLPSRCGETPGEGEDRKSGVLANIVLALWQEVLVKKTPFMCILFPSAIYLAGSLHDERQLGHMLVFG